jgi:hypothetical protein|tara:strand:- start:250 stop:411 length:162 start_codon:yes stop_codon:yes gene_type:complete
VLSDFEATRKSVQSGDYIDMCNGCFHHVKDDMDVVERQDLQHVSDEEIEDDEQ